MPSQKSPRKRKSRWNADNILTNPRSPLARADLRSVLAHPLAWTSLTVEERREVISLFPDASLILDADTDDARPDLESLMNDDGFRAACAVYVENLAQGRHDPQWLRDAWRAHGRRKAGDFDDFLMDKFERDWGPLPEHMRLEAKTNRTGGEEDGPASAGISVPGADDDASRLGDGVGDHHEGPGRGRSHQTSPGPGPEHARNTEPAALD